MDQASAKTQSQLFWEPISQNRWGKYISRVEEKLIRFAHEVSDGAGSALEIGAEGGRWSKLLHDLGWRLTCTDIDSEALAICQERIPGSHCVLVDPDSREFPCESASQELLLTIEVHELVEQGWFVAEAHRVLAENGLFVGVFQNKHSWRVLLNLRSSLAGEMKHYTAGYSPWRTKMKRLGFEFLSEEGICWMPFGRMSDSKFIPCAVYFEKVLGLRQLPALSPWVVFVARKSKVNRTSIGSPEMPNPLNLQQPSPGNSAAGARSGTRILAQWLRLSLFPLIAIATLCGSFFLIGHAQRLGWIEKQMASGTESETQRVEGVRYICPMMCVPPTDDPGRCPVCEMELVPAETGPVLIDPATRRVLNIQTVRAVKASTEQGNPAREIQSVGELAYDEENLKTISAYIDGRIEKLYASYTGVKVSAGEPLAVIYSPPLFVAQKELLVSRRNVDRANNTSSINSSSLYETSRRRLIELGMTASQVDELERSGQANSRLELVAPMSGTVIEKLSVEGQYVKQGDPVYRLANLDQVWLMLKLFPEDAAMIKIGQSVNAAVDSSPGKAYEGTVAFISPSIDPATRTVDVRVVLPNPEGGMRIGDFARASIPISEARGDSDSESETVVVPRDAVLLVGANSVVYVETEPGRYEMRNVKVGSVSNREVFVLEGLKAGESVARRGNFLIDSQMQLAGNPSLIDPGRAAPKKPGEELTPEMEEAIAELAPEDQELAKKQRVCVVADMELGSMGVPVRVELEGQVVFLCCEGCRGALMKDPQKFLEKMKQ